MQTNRPIPQQCVALVKQFEGVRLDAYLRAVV